MKQKSSKKFIAKIILLSFCLSSLLTFSPLEAPKTQAWDAMAANGALFAWNQLADTIKGITLAAAKQAAMQMVLEEVNKLVDDTFGTGTKIIRDWNDYLISSPERQSKKLMNDYLSNITQGRDSSRYRSLKIGQIMAYGNNYEGFGGMDQYQFALIQKARAEGTEIASDTPQGNYDEFLRQVATNITTENDTPPEVTCSDQDRLQMFRGANFDPFINCTSGINYLPTAEGIIRKKYYGNILPNQKDIAQTESISPGVLGSKDKTTGRILTPAGTMENIINKANTLGLDMLAKANTIPEIISAAVVTAIERSIKQGIGSIKDRAQREISNVRKQATSNINKSAQQIGPRAVFKNDRTY